MGNVKKIPLEIIQKRVKIVKWIVMTCIILSIISIFSIIVSVIFDNAIIYITFLTLLITSGIFATYLGIGILLPRTTWGLPKN